MTNNYIIIDGSYFVFYRFYAVLSWWMKKTDSVKTNLIDQEKFVNTFKKTFVKKLKEISKKLSIDSPTIIVCKDCKRENIWRNDEIWGCIGDKRYKRDLMR